tara:strand:+ start:1603 stop:2052 length:450 start_codon:yes stop_codon:yes gene_type:complete
MIYKVIVDVNGNIIQQYSSSEAEPAHGESLGDLTCYNHPHALERDTEYWDGTSFATRVAPPTRWHVWNGSTWEEDLDLKAEVVEAVFVQVRGRRDAHLTASDWTQVADTPLTDSKKAEWVTYRQALRDVPTTNSSVTSLDDVAWPTPPA